MNENERYYRKVMGALGATMLAFLAVMFLVELLLFLLSLAIAMLPITPVAMEVIIEVAGACGYLLAFLLPALFLKMFLQRENLSYRPFSMKPRLSRYLPLIVLAGISVILSAAYFNASLIGLFESFFFSPPTEGGGERVPMESYQIALQVLTVAIVPGFCEEVLFRGAIFENVLPFGRFRAILISSLLFAMMHQNVDQFFYTFAAGLALGVVRERTGNIWNGVILHMSNNLFSVVKSVISANSSDTFTASVYLTVCEAVLILLGFAALVFFSVRFFSKRKSFREGFFEKELPEAGEFTLYPVSPVCAVRLFLTPTMIIFLALAASQFIFFIEGMVL